MIPFLWKLLCLFHFKKYISFKNIYLTLILKHKIRRPVFFVLSLIHEKTLMTLWLLLCHLSQFHKIFWKHVKWVELATIWPLTSFPISMLKNININFHWRKCIPALCPFEIHLFARQTRLDVSLYCQQRRTHRSTKMLSTQCDKYG